MMNAPMERMPLMAKIDPLLADLSLAPPAMLKEIVLSSRIRLERNLEDTLFPRRAGDEQRTEIEARIRPLLQAAGMTVESLPEMTDVNRRCLFESNSISSDLADAPPPGTAYASCAGKDAPTAIINDHNHLALRATRPGLALREAWADALTLEARLDGPLAFAWDEKLGYFTASPGDLGTGLRASTVVHLFGLRLTNELDPVLRGLERLRFVVRGFWNENAIGQVYSIMNLDTLGVAEEEILTRLEAITRTLARLEYQARLRLLYDQRILLEDCLFRTLGLLSNALLSPEPEAIELLSALRMMVALKTAKGITCTALDDLILAVRPAHFIRGGHLPADTDTALLAKDPVMTMDYYRALYLRERLDRVTNTRG